MNNILSGIAIGIAVSVIAFQLSGAIEQPQVVNKNAESEPIVSMPLGLDIDGFLASCSEDGTAINIGRENGFMTFRPREKEGELLPCMTKEEAKNYMLSSGFPISGTETILGQYPDFSKPKT